MNHELRYVKKWLDANKLALNVDKTYFVTIHSHAKMLTEPTALKFGCKKITQADHVRFLGVLLDETLSWKPHLVKLSRKLARSVGIFLQIKASCFIRYTQICLLCTFSSFFLNYGIVVWGLTFENLLNPACAAQNSLKSYDIQ